MEPKQLKRIVEGALMAVNEPLSIERLLGLFSEHEQPSRGALREALDALTEECSERGVELIEVASGFRFQVRKEYAEWVSRLWEERPARYTRALLETLALIAYRQPITRAEIEDIRGVAVSSNIVKTLLERGWVRVIGHREVPGRPALLATTRSFLDYFNLATLDALPPLAELRDFEAISADLEQRAGSQAEGGDSAVEDADNTQSEGSEPSVQIEPTADLVVDVAQPASEQDPALHNSSADSQPSSDDGQAASDPEPPSESMNESPEQSGNAAAGEQADAAASEIPESSTEERLLEAREQAENVEDGPSAQTGTDLHEEQP